MERGKVFGDSITIQFLGFNDKNELYKKDDIVKVETFLLKIYREDNNNDQETAEEIERILVGSAEVVVNPKEQKIEKNLKYTEINISSEKLKPLNNKNISFRILFRVEGLKSINVAKQNQDDKTRKPVTKFIGELLLFSQKKCHVLNGDKYDLVLQEIGSSEKYSLRNFITWETIPSDFVIRNKSFDIFSKPTLQFYINWYINRDIKIVDISDSDSDKVEEISQNSKKSFITTAETTVALKTAPHVELDENEISNKKLHVRSHNRQYYNPEEMENDSEDESDPLWLRQETIRKIDENTDVNEGEKEIMKMWNLHLLRYGFVGDCQIPVALDTFLELKGFEIIRKDLYRYFVLHITTLYDFELISPECVNDCLQKLQSMRSQVECTTKEDCSKDEEEEGSSPNKRKKTINNMLTANSLKDES